MNDFKREDYIYLRYLEDDEDACKKKGDIVRYKKECIIEELKGRRFNTCFDYKSLIWEENPDAAEDEVAFNKVYNSITVADTWNGQVYLWKDDYLYLDDWLFSHLSPYDGELVRRLKMEVLPNNRGDNRMVRVIEGCPDVNARITMHFEKGEVIDFTNPSVVALFYNPYWLKIFTRTEVIVGEEKEQLFQDDFSNAINVSSVDDYCYSANETKEHHYFKIKDNIKVETDEELAELLGMDYLSALDFGIVRDSEGFITHICTVTSLDESSDREMEQIVLKVADRISLVEALEVHEKACLDYVKRQNEDEAMFIAEFERRQQELDDIYQTKKDDPEVFPGVNGDFVHVNREDTINKRRYTLKQIQEFYQNLKKLDPEVVKHICFYGGTIPYILNNASESRDFGDIDMFVPIEYMEKLRDEFDRQESFEMICDSKPYAESCMLTSRIDKEVSETALQVEQPDTLENSISALGETLMRLATAGDSRDYVDEKGIVHNPFNAHKEEQLPYYRKIQDFGFKGKLFGISISVFPIYQYENDLMAKSFNIREMYKFLLGVRVVDNTKLAEFMKQVSVYGSIFNILPLEYTLASKQSAVEGGYAFRSEKDKEDVEYILAHKDELGISDERLKEILKNYPDYSISIAYEINGDQVTTMDGEDYKQLVLTNRNVS